MDLHEIKEAFNQKRIQGDQNRKTAQKLHKILHSQVRGSCEVKVPDAASSELLYHCLSVVPRSEQVQEDILSCSDDN